MNLSLAGAVLVVTGSTQGVGHAVALEAAKNGAEAILITGRDKARGAAVVAEVEALGAKAHFAAADLADPNASDVLADAALAKFDTPAERVMHADTLGKGPDWLAEQAALQPFGRLLSAEDVARLTHFLLSPASEPMTGALIDQEQWAIGPRDA